MSSDNSKIIIFILLVIIVLLLAGLKRILSGFENLIFLAAIVGGGYLIFIVMVELYSFIENKINSASIYVSDPLNKNTTIVKIIRVIRLVRNNIGWIAGIFSIAMMVILFCISSLSLN